MEKRQVYEGVWFSADVVVDAESQLLAVHQAHIDQEIREAEAKGTENWDEYDLRYLKRTASERKEYLRLKIETDKGYWSFDELPEFLAEHRRLDMGVVGADSTYYLADGDGWDLWINCATGPRPICKVDVKAPTRRDIESVFEVFERAVPQCSVEPPGEAPAEPSAPTVFIGHGHSAAWRDLKDHLSDKHGIEVVAYEVGSRAGHAVRDVLDQMMDQSSIAFLVMTAEDETPDGTLRARQNVVHEAGLFQGRLGFAKAVVLVEHGVEVFSNLDGIEQIRFSKDSIRESFGDVLATIARESSPL